MTVMRQDSQAVLIRDGHDNFFTPLRLVFAMLVMVGHAYAIGLRDATLEPNVFYHYTFSYLAVNLFFVASGFLVTKSMLYRGDGPSFLSARLLRIYPALIVHVFFVLLAVGLIATTLPWLSYLTDPQTLIQPLWVLTFFKSGMVLPGVFESNGEPFASAPLWTLRYEILCYIATLGAFSLGLMRKRWMILAQFVLPCLAWMVGQSFDLFDALPGTIENAVRFGIAYGLGATVYAYRDRLRFTWVALPILLAFSWLTHQTSIIEVTVNLLLGWFVIFVAYARLPRLKWMQSIDDISYGIYIYHWVVMQLAFSCFPSLGVTSLFFVCLPIVIGLAWLSWTYVEKPMLAKKSAFGEWLRFGKPAKNRPVILAD
jgi:peptidoglycan/LPS O-acetylase OafA/YrhL